MKLEEVNKKYSGEWVVANVLKMGKLGKPEELDVLFHSKNRDEVYKKQIGLKGLIAAFYAGEIEEEGYAVAFLWSDIFLTKKKE